MNAACLYMCLTRRRLGRKGLERLKDKKHNKKTGSQIMNRSKAARSKTPASFA